MCATHTRKGPRHSRREPSRATSGFSAGCARASLQAQQYLTMRSFAGLKPCAPRAIQSCANGSTWRGTSVLRKEVVCVAILKPETTREARILRTAADVNAVRRVEA